MNIFKYCKRISKESNISFFTIWVISPIYDFVIHGFWDWRVYIGYTLLMITVYGLSVLIIKTIVWDKQDKKNKS